MVHNFGRAQEGQLRTPGLRSACVELHEPTRGSLVEWVWGFLEEYPLSYPAPGAVARSAPPRRPS